MSMESDLPTGVAVLMSMKSVPLTGVGCTCAYRICWVCMEALAPVRLIRWVGLVQQVFGE